MSTGFTAFPFEEIGAAASTPPRLVLYKEPTVSRVNSHSLRKQGTFDMMHEAVFFKIKIKIKNTTSAFLYDA